MRMPNTSSSSCANRLEADRLGDVQVHDQRRQIGAERRARRHAGRWRRTEPATAMRAGAAMPVNAGDDRPNLRQLDMVASVKSELIIRAQLVRAMRATLGEALDNPVRLSGQRPEDAGSALALLRCAPFGAVGFAPLRRRYRGIVRGLGRLAELGFSSFGDPPGQFRNLRRQRLDLRRQRQPQRDQLVPGEFREVILIHPQVESREYAPVTQNLSVYRPRPTICATHPHRPGPHPARG